MSAPSEEAWSGPWADDARRLFRVIQNAAAPDPEADHPHPPECAYCPLCQGISLLRRAGPDVLDRVSELAAGLAGTLRTMDADPPQPAGPTASTGSPEAQTRSGTGPEPGSASGRTRPPSTVRIDVTD